MEEHDIINVLRLANSHHLQHLQWKVEYLRNDIERLEVEKTKCNNHILNLNRIIDEFQGTLSMYESSLAQKRGEMTYMNQESVTYILSHTQNPILLHTSIRLLTHQ
jgi:chromosome segregation ATPase